MIRAIRTTVEILIVDLAHGLGTGLVSIPILLANVAPDRVTESLGHGLDLSRVSGRHDIGDPNNECDESKDHAREHGNLAFGSLIHG